VPAPADTFKAGFKLEASFEALQANEALMGSMKTTICEKFAQTTNTDAAWCSVEFTPGSVNVAVSITAPAGTSLPAHLPAPTPTDITAAVVALPDVSSIQKGSTPISASEVKAVVFKKGETTASVPTTSAPTTTSAPRQPTTRAAPTPPRTPPRTPALPPSGDEEATVGRGNRTNRTSSAMGLKSAGALFMLVIPISIF
jgi:hypothetical protein